MPKKSESLNKRLILSPAEAAADFSVMPESVPPLDIDEDFSMVDAQRQFGGGSGGGGGDSQVGAAVPTPDSTQWAADIGGVGGLGFEYEEDCLVDLDALITLCNPQPEHISGPRSCIRPPSQTSQTSQAASPASPDVKEAVLRQQPVAVNRLSLLHPQAIESMNKNVTPFLFENQTLELKIKPAPELIEAEVAQPQPHPRLQPSPRKRPADPSTDSEPILTDCSSSNSNSSSCSKKQKNNEASRRSRQRRKERAQSQLQLVEQLERRHRQLTQQVQQLQQLRDQLEAFWFQVTEPLSS